MRRRALAPVLALLSSVGSACVGDIERQKGAAPPEPSVTPPPTTPGMVSPPATQPPGEPVPPPASKPAEPPPSLPNLKCEVGNSGATPRRLWRLSARQYVNTVAVFLNGRKSPSRTNVQPPSWLIAPFEAATSAERFSNYASSFTMTDFELRRAVSVSTDIAAALVAQLRKDTKSCLGAPGMPFVDCVRAQVETRGPLLFQRPLTADEVAFYTGLASKSVGTIGEDEAAALAFQQMLLAPSFLFRQELGQGTPDAAGRVRLTPFELAAALSFALTDWPPDEPLYKAAAAGQLGSSEEIRAQAVRLLGAFSKSSTTTLRFLREFFRYDGVTSVFKDVKDYFPDMILRDTESLVADLLTNNGATGLLKALLTTDAGYYNKRSEMVYAPLKAPTYEPTRFVFPAGERAGLLTQPSFLIAFSETHANMPVQRGRFVNESLLCRPVPELPIGLVPVIPEDPNRTLRERLAIHSADPSCAACHKMMDPVGLAFERYDHVGRIRTTEAGKPVDASGVLTGIAGGDIAFRDAVELMNKLAAAPLVEECFMRHSFRFWMGRNEQPHDACAIGSALEAYRKSGGDYREAVVALVSSDAFVLRSVK